MWVFVTALSPALILLNWSESGSRCPDERWQETGRDANEEQQRGRARVKITCVMWQQLVCLISWSLGKSTNTLLGLLGIVVRHSSDQSANYYHHSSTSEKDRVRQADRWSANGALRRRNVLSSLSSTSDSSKVQSLSHRHLYTTARHLFGLITCYISRVYHKLSLLPETSLSHPAHRVQAEPHLHWDIQQISGYVPQSQTQNFI